MVETTPIKFGKIKGRPVGSAADSLHLQDFRSLKSTCKFSKIKVSNSAKNVSASEPIPSLILKPIIVSVEDAFKPVHYLSIIQEMKVIKNCQFLDPPIHILMYFMNGP